MAQNDIYNSKAKYENFKKNFKTLLHPNSERRGTSKYYCKNIDNLQYFPKLFTYFESKDLSYVGRTRMISIMKFIVYYTRKELSGCNREDIDKFMTAVHNTYNSIESKKTFIKGLKHIWKILFPELDQIGRPDETIVPYTVRHLSAKIDKSRQKLRTDKFTLDEFEKIINYFGSDPRIQAYLTLSLESLGRPQELLYLKISDVELHDNYAKIFISEHGKEGTGLLQCIDSYPYILKWLEIHPLKNDQQAYLFVNTGNTNTCKQLKPSNINKMIRKACKDLKINKPITCYSLKRNGVTIRRLRGESDMEIQHAARWTSTNQLKTYDLSNQDEAFKLALEKRGLIKSGKPTIKATEIKTCLFCDKKAGFGETICHGCKHPLDREMILNEKQKDEEIQRLKETVSSFQPYMEKFREEIMQELAQKIFENKAVVNA